MIAPGGVLDGQVALVTGAAAGIGHAIAVALASSGAHVVLADADDAGGQAAADTLKAQGCAASAAVLDVSNTEAGRSLIGQIDRRHGRLDILVNNAALGGGESFADVTEARFDRLFAVNVRGAFFLAQAAAAVMKRSGRGRIINISSLIAAKGAPGNPHYAGAKAALLGFTRAWAVELAPSGVTVNTVLPALTITPMAQGAMTQAQLDARAAANPMGRLGAAEDVAAAVLYLCSPGSDFVSGQSISPNGAEFVGAL